MKFINITCKVTKLLLTIQSHTTEASNHLEFMQMIMCIFKIITGHLPNKACKAVRYIIC